MLDEGMSDMDKLKQLKKRIAVSQRKQPADLIIRNGKIADVFTLSWKDADIVITDGIIVAIDESRSFEAFHEEDASGKYIVPGLIDGHIHIESSMVTPSEFANALLPRGVTAVVTDPHEIANVSGVEGIKFMIEDAERSDMDIFIMLPSSVPSTSFEHAGAVLTADDLKPLLSEPTVLGLAEVMDYPAVLSGDETILKKLAITADQNMPIDGHGAGLNSEQIRGYRAAGIQTDHECVTAEEALDRIAQGMYVMIREGSAAKNLKALLPAVTTANARRFLFCTDDKHLDELLMEGSVDHAVRLAISEGMEPIQAIQLATLNAAECFGLKNRGALAAGYRADLFTTDRLDNLIASTVWKDGKKVAENLKPSEKTNDRAPLDSKISHSIHLPKLVSEDFSIPLIGNKANVMQIIPDQIMTKKVIMEVPSENGYFQPDTNKDLLKLAVIERHKGLGNIGLGIVTGFGLKRGAVATTVAHDSHNLIVLGTNDDDMLLAVETLKETSGGLVVTDSGKVLSCLPLPIAGLMTDVSAEEAASKLKELHDSLDTICPDLDFHLFLTLSFLSLPVIPELKLTDTGLFDVTEFRHIPLEAK